MKIFEILDQSSLTEAILAEMDNAGSVGFYIDDLTRNFKSAQKKGLKPKDAHDLLTSLGELIVYKEQKTKLDWENEIIISLLGYTVDANPKKDLSEVILKKDALARAYKAVVSDFLITEVVDYEKVYEWLIYIKGWFVKEAKRLGPALRPLHAEKNAKPLRTKGLIKDRATIAKTIGAMGKKTSIK